MTVAESKQMKALLDGIERMTCLINRCRIYEILHLQHEQVEQEELKQALSSLRSSLLTLYVNILTFLESAIQTFGHSSVTRTFRAVLTPDKVSGFLESCDNLEKDLKHEVDNCEHAHTRRVQTISAEQISKLNDFLVELDAPILRIDSGVTRLCEKLDSSERSDILLWISNLPYEEYHNFARQGWIDGTGQ